MKRNRGRFIVILGFLSTTGLFFPDPAAAAEDQPFIRGDTNTDGRISLSNVLAIRRFLFNFGPIPCADTFDVNDSNGWCLDPDDPDCKLRWAGVDIADAAALLNALFDTGCPPFEIPEPFQQSGNHAQPRPSAVPSSTQSGKGALGSGPPRRRYSRE